MKPIPLPICHIFPPAFEERIKVKQANKKLSNTSSKNKSYKSEIIKQTMLFSLFIFCWDGQFLEVNINFLEYEPRSLVYFCKNINFKRLKKITIRTKVNLNQRPSNLILNVSFSKFNIVLSLTQHHYLKYGRM